MEWKNVIYERSRRGSEKNNERKKDDKLDVESSCFSVSDQTRGKALF